MTRVPENAVQQALAGKGRKSHVTTEACGMDVRHRRLLIALDSAAGVGGADTVAARH